MIAQVAKLSAAAGVGVAGVNRALAQDATPVVGGASGCSTPLSTAVTFKSVEGQPLAILTATKMVDPFSGYNPAYPPPRGNRFLLVGLKVENVGVNPYVFDPSRVYLQDADGFVVYPSGVDLGAEPVEVGFAYQEIPPATVAEGVIGFVLIQGVVPIRAFFSPSSDRMLLLADLA
jgi:hypothetical protein